MSNKVLMVNLCGILEHCTENLENKHSSKFQDERVFWSEKNRLILLKAIWYSEAPDVFSVSSGAEGVERSKTSKAF